MDELIKKIESVMEVLLNISEDIDKNNNYSSIPELMNLLEVVIPNIFSVNGNNNLFENEDVLTMLDNIVDAYDNKDSVLMTDVLIYGLYDFFNNFIKTVSIKG